MSQRAFTVGMIRRLRQFGPLPRCRRIPPQQQPDVIRLEYYKALLPFVHVSTAAFHEVQHEVLYLYATDMRAQGRLDSPSSDDMKRLITRAERLAEDELGQRRLEEIARRFGQRLSGFQREQLDKQVRAALGVPLSLIEPYIVERLDEFAALNVDLIKSVSSRYFDRLRLDVEQAYADGERPETLAKRFVERDGMAERDARRIARDQIGKLNAQFNQARQENLGIVGYTWRTMNDNRVRHDHQDRDGKAYTWKNPPHDGHPGEPIQCRCYAEPDFTPILDGL